jgi:hypothetical protein
MLLHDDARATKAVGSIGYVANHGRRLGGVEIDPPRGSAIEGSERLRGSEPNLMPYRKNRLWIIVGRVALCLSTGI